MTLFLYMTYLGKVYEIPGSDNKTDFSEKNAIICNRDITKMSKGYPIKAVYNYYERSDLYESINKDKKLNQVSGIPNIGNTCYMNSVLQCLLATPLVAEILENEISKSSSTNVNLAKVIMKIIESRKEGAISIDDLKKLKKLVSTHNERFCGNSLYDPAEFIITLICGIDLESKREELKIDGEDVLLKRYEQLINDGEKEIAAILKASLDEMIQINANGSSDFINLFRAQIYSEIKCKGGCDSVETCFEDRIMMELDIPKGKRGSDLMECFERTFEEVYYNEENENFCDKCNKITCFTREEWISRLPKIMIIHLKRFETNAYGEQQRNNKSIEFPIKDLDVSPIVHDYFKESNPNFKYHLHGVSIHRGTLHGGHYTATIKNMPGDMKWYECDDNSTRIIDEPESYGAGPYVLFYHRNDVTI